MATFTSGKLLPNRIGVKQALAFRLLNGGHKAFATLQRRVLPLNLTPVFVNEGFQIGGGDTPGNLPADCISAFYHRQREF